MFYLNLPNTNEQDIVSVKTIPFYWNKRETCCNPTVPIKPPWTKDGVSNWMAAISHRVVGRLRKLNRDGQEERLGARRVFWDLWMENKVIQLPLHCSLDFSSLISDCQVFTNTKTVWVNATVVIIFPLFWWPPYSSVCWKDFAFIFHPWAKLYSICFSAWLFPSRKQSFPNHSKKIFFQEDILLEGLVSFPSEMNWLLGFIDCPVSLLLQG